MLKGAKRTQLLLVLGALFVLQLLLQNSFMIKRWQRDYSPNAGGLIAAQLSPDQILLQLFGFREFLAGILWVRADGFFDDGNYDAILPIIRLCTILDPKQIDIYATGMWHIGYNFTDSEQRSDRRYIPSALALGKEGAKQNPNTYEMFFETGWMWWHKIQDDPEQAVKWFHDALERPDMLPARQNMMAHAYEKSGQIDLALKTFYKLYDQATTREEQTQSFGNSQIRDTLEQNIDTMIVRMTERGYFAQERHDGSFESGNYDTKPPFDTGFSVKATVIAPKDIKFEGTWNVLPVGTRIRVVIRDKDYPHAKFAELDWDRQSTVNLDPPTNLTFCQDDFYVKNRRFTKEIDMRPDPTMYPFTSKDYLIEFYYNPRYAPPHIQDKFGWSGEGMLDSHFDNTTIRPGVHCMYTTLSLTQDQILQRGDWVDRPAVVKTSNYVEPKDSGSKDEIIKVPTLRGGN